MNLTFPVFSLILLTWVLSPWTNPGPGDDDRQIINHIDQYLQAGVPAGLSGNLLVAKQGQVLLSKGYGLADRERGLPYTKDTVFTTGSVTKQFTATAILKLVEQGKLDVSDPLEKFFTGLPPDKQGITIHQLLTHTSGFTGGIGKGDFDPISQEAFFQSAFASELLHEPGETYDYSNLGYSILGRIIELVSGQEYEQFLREQLFLPAGMQQTGYLLQDWDSDPVAKGYFQGVVPLGSLKGRYQKAGQVYWPLKANGGIDSTLEDMFRWYEALKLHKVLSPAMTKVLTTAYVPENEEGSSHYAYGWAIFTSLRNTKIVSHNGSNGVHFFDFIWFPEEDVLVLWATNSVTRHTQVAWPVARMLFDTNYQPPPIRRAASADILEFLTQRGPGQLHRQEAFLKQKFPAEMGRPTYLNWLGYMALNVLKKPDWAVAIYELNTRYHPGEGKLWHSLGGGYLAQNRREEAISAYRKAVDLGNQPSNQILEGLIKR